MIKHKLSYRDKIRHTHFYFILHGIKNGLKDLSKPIIKLQSDKIVINPDEVKIWMIGHASVLINFYGVTILTDPVLVNWLPFPRRITAPGFTAKQLPHINYVLISHVHLDHLSKKSLRQIAWKADTLIVPKNCLSLVRNIKCKNKVELDWQEHTQFKDLGVYVYRPEHIGKRMPWDITIRGYNCYLLKRNGKSILFAGDTGYGDFHKTIAKNHKADLVLLGIGSYKSYASLKNYHMGPGEALKVFKDLEASHFVPIHWGNFRLGMEPMEEPVEMLKELVKKDNLEGKVHILENGRSFKLP